MREARFIWTVAWLASACSVTHGPLETGEVGQEVDSTRANEPAAPPPDEPEAEPGGNLEGAAVQPADEPPVKDQRSQESIDVVLAEDAPELLEGECPPDFGYDESNPVIPAAPELPAASDLPPACDEAAAIASAIDACGPIQRVDFDGSIADALARCDADRFCHVLVPAGEHSYLPQEPEDDEPGLRCVMLEGAGAQQTRIETSGFRTAEHVVLARLQARAGYGVVSAESGPLLVNEAELVGGYEGLGASWGAAGSAAVCRSVVRAGYGAVGLSWESSNLVVAGSAIAACYEGIGLSWESHHALVVGNDVFGAYAAVATSWGSHDLTVLGNRLTSTGGDGWPGAAVDLHEAHTVKIQGNVVTSGVLPASDPARSIVVDGNEIR